MNSVCVISASFHYVFDDSARGQDGAASRLIELVNISIEQGASVIDLGAMTFGTLPAGGSERLARIVADIRDVYPEAIFQITAHSFMHLADLLRDYRAFAPDIVSVPLSAFFAKDATAILRSQEEQVPRLRSSLVLDLHDLSMLFQAVSLQNDGLLKGPLRVNFCFGQEFGIPSDRHAFGFFVQTLRRLAPDAMWSGIGRGKSELELARWSMDTGGHCKAIVSAEANANDDSHDRDKATLSRVVQLCKEYGRRPASFAEARRVLSLDDATQVSLV
ncbi:3-keto-5-aminohexanoate cleavage protein [Caballeronia sordidicola]|uniref:3-keto-5-aminohexanoate cleavage protein n=1 Tax=Caballeronia sordidicola TaxID=196367 RepID=UPI00068FEA23|nr:3-keto-5-aminohexanoate cleavage protein [Caballeronia sordidicola]